MDSLLSMERTNDLDVNDEETAGGGSAVLSPFAGKAFNVFGLSLTAIVVPKRECREMALRTRSRRSRSSKYEKSLEIFSWLLNEAS